MATKVSVMENLRDFAILGAFVMVFALFINSFPGNAPVENNEYEEIEAYAATMTTNGDATLVSSGRNYMVTGGSFSDSMGILANRSVQGSRIISIDCSNGTGDNCIILYSK